MGIDPLLDWMRLRQKAYKRLPRPTAADKRRTAARNDPRQIALFREPTSHCGC
jgi:hypothetical protein